MLENDIQIGRSIIFMFTDDEEFGLDGAEQWIQYPTVSEESIVFGVSTDPLGRPNLPDFDPIVLIGLERSPELGDAWRKAAEFVDNVYFINRSMVPVFASDQDPFFEEETPALWFTNIGFSFYHTTDDRAETIDYRTVLRDAKLLVYALSIIGNTNDRYTYTGPVDPNGADAAEALRLIEDLLLSDYPDNSDREMAEFYSSQLTDVVEADSHDVLATSVESFYVGALYFLLFDLPAKYPGEIPPPWPDDG